MAPNDEARFKWTEKDNAIGKAEARISEILTSEANSHPELAPYRTIDLRSVTDKIRPFLTEIRKANGGRAFVMNTKIYGRPGHYQIDVAVV